MTALTCAVVRAASTLIEQVFGLAVNDVSIDLGLPAAKIA
jgi:hypothetical protein